MLQFHIVFICSFPCSTHELKNNDFSMKKKTVRLKREHFQILRETYPDSFEIVETDVKVKSEGKNYILLMQVGKNHTQLLMDTLGMTYVGYMHVLLESLDYSNRVDFNVLSLVGVTERSIGLCKQRMREANVVVKRGGNYYLNPLIAIKGTTIDPDLVALFDNDEVIKKPRKPRTPRVTPSKSTALSPSPPPKETTKEKKSTNVFPEDFDDVRHEELREKLKEFAAYRTDTRHPIKKASRVAFLKNLARVSNSDADTAILILDRSIANGWQGIFSLDEKRTSITQKT